MRPLRQSEPSHNLPFQSSQLHSKTERKSAPKTIFFSDRQLATESIPEKENAAQIEMQNAAQEEDKENQVQFYQRPFGLAKSTPKMGFSKVKYQNCEKSLEELMKSCKKKIPKIYGVKDSFGKKDYERYVTPEELEYIRKEGAKTQEGVKDPLTEEERAERREQIKNRMCFVPLQHRPLKLKSAHKLKKEE